MLKTTVTFEITNGLILGEHPLPRHRAQAELGHRPEDIAPRHLELKWVTTEPGLEARWTVHPDEPAHFVLRNGRIVPAALAEQL